MVKTKCSFCKKELNIKPSRLKRNNFCSKKCYDRWQKKIRGENHKNWNRIKTKCSYCGKTIYIIPSRFKKYKNNFCNITCSSKWKKERYIGKNNPHWNRVDTNCAFCGKEILIKRSKSTKNSFCSSKCYISWKKETSIGKNNPNYSAIKTICGFCGKQICKERNKHKKYKHHFCSRECCSKWEIDNTPKGEKNPNWKGGKFPYYGKSWLKNRRTALENARFKSEISGEPTNIVHHIMPLKSYLEHAFDMFLYLLPCSSYKQLKFLSYELIPDIFFDEANKPTNLCVLTNSEHPKYEGKPISLFRGI